MPVKEDTGNGRQREEDVVPAEGVEDASGEVGKVSRKPIAGKRYGGIVSAEIHQVDNEQHVQQQHGGYLCLPKPEELVGGKQDERGYYLGRIEFDGRE